MFRVQSTESGKNYRLAIVSLLVLSVAALAITIWVMVEFLHEQEIVQELIRKLPNDATASAEELAGELRWQFRLSILVVLNLVVTGFSVLLLWRAYRTSQESLRDIKALAADILSSIDQAVITTNLAGNVTSINRRGIEILGLTDEHVSRPLSELSGSLHLEAFRIESGTGDTTVLVRDFPFSTDQTTRTLRAFCQPLNSYDKVEIGNVIQLRDVTERVLLDDRVRRMERYMGLGSLAAGLHHEIKNPLTALSLHVQLLEEELAGPDTTDTVHEMLGVIKTEVMRVGAVLEGFRDFASLSRLNTAPIDLANIIDRQVKLIAPQAENHAITVTVDLPQECLPQVNADRVRLEQVLLNLLVNSMDAMPNGGDLTIRAVCDDTPHADFVRVQVIDTGGGIPESIRERIFDAYFTTKSEGTGMGLALSDKIIRQHHGSLECHNITDGTVFEIKLPI